MENIKEFLLKRRNESKANLRKEAIEEEGYFDADSYSGGNFDDCVNMGIEIGEAEFIEKLLDKFFKEEN